MIFLPSVSTNPLSLFEFRFWISIDFFLFENTFKSFFESVFTVDDDLGLSIGSSFWDKFSNSWYVNDPKCFIVVLLNKDRSEQRQMPIWIDLFCRRKAINSDLTRSIVNAIGGLRILVSLRYIKTSPENYKIYFYEVYLSNRNF